MKSPATNHHPTANKKQEKHPMKTKSRSLSIMLSLSVAMTLILTQAAKADPIAAYTINNPNPLTGNYMVGFEFTPTATFDISALGYWDQNHDGLSSSHQVAIYYATTGGGHNAGDQVAGALTTVQIADSGATLDIGNDTNGWFAYHTLSSNVTLLAATQYIIVANTNGIASGGGVGFDYLSYGALAAHTNTAAITTGAGWFANNPFPYGANVFFPTTRDANNFYSTPNFLVAAPVPEPSTMALLCICAMALFKWKIRSALKFPSSR